MIPFLEDRHVKAEAISLDCILYILLNFDVETLKQSASVFFREFYDFTYSLAEIYHDYTLSMGVSRYVEDVSGIPGTLHGARNAAFSFDEQSGNRLIFDQDTPSAAPNAFTFDYAVLKASLELLDKDRANAWFTSMCEKIEQTRIGRYDKLCAYEKLFVGAEKLIARELQGVQWPASSPNIHREFLSCINVQEIQTLIKKYFNDILAQYIQLKNLEPVRPVREAKKYIEDHFGEEISLEKVAEHVYLSPVYLSIIFKNEEGITFNKYLTKSRMDKAKMLLKDPQYSIHQIAAMVGYKDLRYFIQLFKKNTGITPSQFRKINI